MGDIAMTDAPSRQSCLVVLIGPPGSGKSEWTRRNAAGTVVVSQDDLINAITPHGFDYAYRPVYAAAEDAIGRSGLAAGFTVIVDRTNRTRVLRERWVGIAREAGCPVVAVEMTAGAELCRMRNQARSGRWRVSDERMERMLSVMEPVSGDEGFAGVFRDDEVSLQEILEYLRRRAGKESHEYCNQTG